MLLLVLFVCFFPPEILSRRLWIRTNLPWNPGWCHLRSLDDFTKDKSQTRILVCHLYRNDVLSIFNFGVKNYRIFGWQTKGKEVEDLRARHTHKSKLFRTRNPGLNIKMGQMGLFDRVLKNRVGGWGWSRDIEKGIRRGMMLLSWPMELGENSIN